MGLMNDNYFLFGSQITWWPWDFYLKHMCGVRRKTYDLNNLVQQIYENLNVWFFFILFLLLH